MRSVRRSSNLRTCDQHECPVQAKAHCRCSSRADGAQRACAGDQHVAPKHKLSQTVGSGPKFEDLLMLRSWTLEIAPDTQDTQHRPTAYFAVRTASSLEHWVHVSEVFCSPAFCSQLQSGTAVKHGQTRALSMLPHRALRTASWRIARWARSS